MIELVALISSLGKYKVPSAIIPKMAGLGNQELVVAAASIGNFKSNV